MITERMQELAGMSITEASEKKAGFDLTTISATKWKELLKLINANSERPTKERNSWRWTGAGVSVWAGNDPISGKYAIGSSSRDDEKNYASYIGIQGQPDKVKMVVDFIKKNGRYKDFNPNDREFI